MNLLDDSITIVHERADNSAGKSKPAIRIRLPKPVQWTTYNDGDGYACDLADDTMSLTAFRMGKPNDGGGWFAAMHFNEDAGRLCKTFATPLEAQREAIAMAKQFLETALADLVQAERQLDAEHQPNAIRPYR